jgi:hypothetical protein
LPTVAATLRAAVGEAVKLLQGDKASAALVVEGVPYGHAGGLLKTFELTQEALKRAGGDAAQSSGVLVAAADQAWNDAEKVYEIEAGKKLSLEQLAQLYSDLSDSGWLRMVVRPFRECDMSAGCELVRAHRPNLVLVADLPLDDEGAAAARTAPQGAAAYGAAFRLRGGAADVLGRYVEAEPQWREAGGCAVCAFLDGAAAAGLPSAVELLAAFGQTQVLLLAPDVTGPQLTALAACADDAPLRALLAGS